MLLGKLNNFKVKILQVLLPLFILSGISFNIGSGNNLSSEKPRDTVVLNIVPSGNYAGAFNSGEHKQVLQAKVLLALNSIEKNSSRFSFSSIYNSTIRNESIKNSRLRTFITTQFATST